MDRKLATIQKIKSLIPIENADKIVLAEFEDIAWRCIVNKDDFKVGDYAVYIEIDAVLPDESKYEFLRKRCWVDNGLVKGFRIRSMKMKGVLSQGICFPLSVFSLEDWDNPKVGLDFTHDFSIVKYESPEERKTGASTPPKKFWAKVLWIIKRYFPKESKKFPSWCPKTDEERIQNLPNAFTEHKKELFYVTEKLDGCLEESTLISTENGEITIKDLYESKKKQKVFTISNESGIVELKKIKNYSIKENINNWYEIELENNEKIILTEDHKVFLPDLNIYREVKFLKENDLILLKK